MNNFSSKIKKICRICENSDLHTYIDLGLQPPSNSFLKAEEILYEKKFPLEVQLCQQCGLSQLTEVVASEDIFDEYAYLSSTSQALVNHYQGMVNDIIKFQNIPSNSLVIDVGCNDGITLSRYPIGEYRLLGVEPSSAGDYAVKNGFNIEKLFFNTETALKIRDKYGLANVLTATNVFAHVDDIRSFTKGVSILLDKNGIFVVEFPYLIDMIEHLYFDTIYHEHLSYLALTPLVKLFADHNMRPFRVQRVDVGASGPGLRLFVCLNDSSHSNDHSIGRLLHEEKKWGIQDKNAYALFADRVLHFKKNVLTKIQNIKANGHKIGAYGAPAKGNTMLNYLGLNKQDIIAVAENNSLKIDLLTPGTHLPIVSDDTFSYHELDKIFDEYIPSLNYKVRGIYFEGLKNMKRDKTNRLQN